MSEVTKQNATFDEWLKALTKAAESDPFDMQPEHAKGYCEDQPESWRSYFNGGYTPQDAITEDWTNA